MNRTLRTARPVDLIKRETKISPPGIELLAWLHKEKAELNAQDAFVVPLWFPQQKTWLEDPLNSDNAVYNYPLLLRIRGSLNETALQHSLEEIIRRHETLRSVFRVKDGKLIQIVIPPWQLTLPVTDLSGLPKSEREGQAQRLALKEALQPFDLARAPSLRSVLMRLEQDDHMLQLTSHHIIHDGWSTAILSRELAALYECFDSGMESPLHDLSFQYGDYVRWQEEQLPAKASRITYWEEQLARARAFQHLTPDFPQSAGLSNRGAREHSVLPTDLIDSLKTLSRQERVSLFMVLLAGFQCLLHRYSNHDEIGIASCAANRLLMEAEGLIGRFANDIFLRTSLTGNPTFRELLLRVRETCLHAYSDQDLPFAELLKGDTNGADPNPELPFQVMFILQNGAKENWQSSTLTMGWLPLDTGTAKYDLNVWLKLGSSLEVILEYRPDLFRAATMTQILHDYEAILRIMAKDPGTRVSDIFITGKAQPVDEAALVAGAKEVSTTRDSTPTDEVEARLLELWTAAFQMPIGLNQNLFELGGDSLFAARLFMQMEKAFKIALPLAVLVEAPTIRQLAAVISNRKMMPDPKGVSTNAPSTPGSSPDDPADLRGNLVCHRHGARPSVRINPYEKREGALSGIKNRLLQRLAMTLPGGWGLRVALHRLRGVHIGEDVWIGYEALIETAYPDLVSIGDRVIIGIRCTLLAHFQELTGVRINDDVYIGPCALILPGVTIGQGAVVSAGSVVTQSVPPMTVVQGNPARRVAVCGIPLGVKTSRAEFMKRLKKVEAEVLLDSPFYRQP